MIDINVNINLSPSILELFKLLAENQGRIMSELSDIKDRITSMSTSVDELQADVTALITMLPAAGGLTAEETAEIKAALEALDTRLKAAAGIFTPTPPTP